MLRSLPALFIGIFLFVGLLDSGVASAQTTNVYQINSVTPANQPSGSGDTVLTVSGNQSSRVVQPFNLCFYTGSTSATIVPSSTNQGSVGQPFSFTYTVPGASFQTAGSARTANLYLLSGPGSDPTGCTGTNPGFISNTYNYSISASNYAIRSASPSTLPSGSPDTDITLSGTFPTFATDGTGLGLCFYNGTANAPLLPRSQSGTANVSFTIPAADFTNAGTASVYLAPYTSTCHGTNPGYSNSLAYTITQSRRFSIQSASPSSLPAGGGNVQVSLYGSLVGSEVPSNYGVCFYTGPGTTPAAIKPDAFTTTEIDFTVPASALQIPPSAFTAGAYNAQVQLGSLGTACTATAQGVSNVYSIPVVFPSVASASLAALAQVNPSVPPYQPSPNSLEVLGANLLPGAAVRFVLGDTASILYEQPTTFINSGAAVAQLPSLSDFTSTTVSVCNYSIGRAYEYCGASSLALPTYPLASTTTQLTSNPAAPARGTTATLTATITPGSGSNTAGGTYVPGPPTGTVTFKDGQTSLGTAPLLSGSLSLANASSQIINVNAGTDAAPVGGDATHPGAKPAPSPNETPLPIRNSQFTSLTADFNQDGLQDLLLIQANTGVMHLFFGGSPPGTLQAESTLLQAGYECSAFSAVTVADLNGDGFPDIAYLCASSEGQPSLSILLNQRDGTFPEYSFTIAHVGANQLAAADVNHDGKVDLVVTGEIYQPFGSNTVYGIQTYLNTGTLDSNGHPVFANPDDGQTTLTADLPGTQIVLRDLNQDGNADLTLLHYNTATSATEVTVFQGDGAGAFTPIAPIPVCSCNTSTSKLFVTPLTTSSLYPDLIVSFPDTPSVITALNTHTATLAFATPATQSFPNLRDAVLGDFNADGFTDLAWYNGRFTSIASGNGTGNFTLNPNFQPLDTGTGVRTDIALAAAPDLNLDGFADLLAVRPLIEMDTTTIESYVTTGTASASLSTSAFTTPGSHNLTTTYPGNLDLLGSSGALTVTLAQITPIITWSPPSTTNTTTPTSAFLNATANVPGIFAYTYTPANATYLPAGTQAITATFTPTDTNTYSSPSTSRPITVNKTNPIISTTINPASHTYTPNLATTYTALITGVNILPTGTVQFENNNTPISSPAGSSQSGPSAITSAITFDSLPAGAFAFTAFYAGDAIYNAVTSTITNYTVTPSTPTLTYTPGPSAIPYGTGLTAAQLNAIAADPTTAATLPGTFTYSTPTLPNLQPGAILPTGTNILTASFTPSSANYATTAATATINVTSATSSTNLAITPSSTVTSGTVITLTATVTTPTLSPLGQVNFCDASTTCTGSHLLGSAQLTPAGTASLRFIPTIGTHTYTALFNGTKQDTPSTSTPATLTITGTYPTATTLAETGTPGNYTLTATTTGTGTLTASPTGLVTFTDTSNANTPLAAAALRPGTTTQTFPTQAISTGVTGSIVLTTDLNNDGIPDLITGTLVNPSVNATESFSVYLGNGNGTFSLKSTLSGQGTDVVPGDFNHDGILDLAVASSIDGTLVTLFGNGDGTFILAATSTIPASSGSLLVGDFNQDGILDIATCADITDPDTNAVTGAVTLLLGAGNGTFNSVRSAIPTAASTLVTNDYNGDGVPDLAATSLFGTSISILTGSGDGTFTPRSSLPVPTGTILATADFNNDGLADLALLNYYDTSVTTYLGKGDGTFTLKATIPNPTALQDQSNAFNILVADFNNDGIPDFATVADDGVYIYRGTGDGSSAITARALPQTTSPFTGEDFGLVVADFNNDGIPDIAANASATLATNAFVALNTLTSTSTATATNIAPIGTNPHPIIATYPGDPNFQSSTSTPVSLTGQLLTPTITWTPALLTVGTPLSAAQLNAAATGLNGISLPGTFTYTPSAGSFLPAGLQRLSATFTPADLVDYAPVTTASTVRINSLPTAITLASSRNPSTFAQSTTLTATISPVGGSSTIPSTGPVTFTEGTTTLGTAQATNGLASLPIATLSAGTHLLTVTYAGDTNYLPSVTLIAFSQAVNKATPTLLFPTPAPLPVGTPLTSAQLNPTATGANGTTLPGTFTYTPAVGSLVTPGPQTLTALFTPTDTTNYTPATISTTLNGTPVTLFALSARTATVGDPARTLTLTGTGFVPTSIALANGTPLNTTYINSTTLAATIPASALRTVQTLQITVNDPTQQQTTTPLPFTITAPATTVKVTAPANANPGDQPTIQSTLATPYPVDVTATYTLSFAPLSGTVTDPAVQFTTGGSTTSVILPAGQTATPNLQLQTGTVAGTISITLRLTLANGGTDITPPGLAPTLILIPTIAPHLTSVSLTRSGRQLTVSSIGYSNSRQVTQATFHFTPSDGQTIQTPDTTIDVGALFNGWYSQTASTAYGSTFLYTQVFTLDDDASIVGQVTVTLSNGVGTSASGSSQP